MSDSAEVRPSWVEEGDVLLASLVFPADGSKAYRVVPDNQEEVNAILRGLPSRPPEASSSQHPEASQSVRADPPLAGEPDCQAGLSNQS